MTREAMIKVLRYKAEHIKTRIKPEFFTEVADALEQQSEDVISRYGVPHKIAEFFSNWDGDENAKMEISVEDMREISSMFVTKCRTESKLKALEQEPVLDKIRAEIEKLRLHKAQFITSNNKVCIDSQEALNIIDKYRTENEDKE